jgi:hypothetical protein
VDGPVRLGARDLAPLARLPRLGWLGADPLDDGMSAIASMPALRMLMCQDTPAGDEAWVALGASTSLEAIWGRRCRGLGDRGFVALSRIPTLRALSVSLRDVSDRALARLATFPALRELMPVEIAAQGFRHAGAVGALERLVCMYTPQLDDDGMRQLAGLAGLRRFHASSVRITDTGLAVLASLRALEEITLGDCPGVTAGGIAGLSSLPRLRTLEVGAMPWVTEEVAGMFRRDVRVRLD